MRGLAPVPFSADPAHVLAPRAAEVVRVTRARLDELLAAGLRERLPCFAPADPVAVDAALAALAPILPRRSLFLEWGAATGTITALAALRGLRALGIEVVPELADAARETLRACGVDAEIATGSFVPAGHEPDPLTLEHEAVTVVDGPDGYDALGRDLDELDAVYAFPWPGTEPLYADLFARQAAPHALLLLHCARDGVRAYRRGS